MIPITTPKGTFNVYTKRVGNNPKKSVLLLHGGPGGTHEEFECFDGYLPNASLKNWNVTSKLKTIKTPTLVIGATYDTMDPKHMEWMANEVQNARFLLCANGSHLSQYDDQKTYFNGLIKFIKDVNQNNF